MKLDSSAFVAAPELLQVLEGHSTAISCGGDRVLFSQGDAPTGVYILSRGATTLTMTSPHRRRGPFRLPGRVHQPYASRSASGVKDSRGAGRRGQFCPPRHPGVLVS